MFVINVQNGAKYSDFFGLPLPLSEYLYGLR